MHDIIRQMTVFNYTSYKEFLRDHIAALPKGGRGEINRMAEKMGVHPTLVSQVLGGDKDFSLEQSHKLCAHLGLFKLEKDYFLLLLQWARAGSHDLKVYYEEKIEEVRQRSLNIKERMSSHRSLTDYERSVFYSSWIYSALRLFTSVGEGQTLAACAERFGLPLEEAAEILTFLTETNLVLETNGRYTMKAAHTHLELGSPFLPRHHTNWRLQTIQKCERLSQEELMFTSPFSVSRADFLKIREELTALIQSSSKIIRASPAEDVACLNLDLVWMKRKG